MIGHQRFNGSMPAEISHKEVLRYIAVAIISLLGVAGVLQGLNSGDNITSRHQVQQSDYGTSVYGE